MTLSSEWVMLPSTPHVQHFGRKLQRMTREKEHDIPVSSWLVAVVWYKRAGWFAVVGSGWFDQIAVKRQKEKTIYMWINEKANKQNLISGEENPAQNWPRLIGQSLVYWMECGIRCSSYFITSSRIKFSSNVFNFCAICLQMFIM